MRYKNKEKLVENFGRLELFVKLLFSLRFEWTELMPLSNKSVNKITKFSRIMKIFV